MTENKKYVKVVVLGDLGRSPRMQYHCLSLSEMGHQVDVIGYGETEPFEAIKCDPSIFYHYLMPVPQISIKLLNYVFKTIFQAINLLILLFITSKADAVLVQNPPAIPSLLVCWFYALVVRAEFVIDWHNYAHSIMALGVGERHPLVKITKMVEAFFGRKAEHNFCVTKAMKADLKKQFGIEATILYDRPPSMFRPLLLEEKHNFYRICGVKYHKVFSGDSEKESAFTTNVQSKISLKERRPGLLVSSTSWTEDEDFSVLLAALQDYENHCQNGNARNLPNLICAITGKGPLKSYYLKKLVELNWQHVTVITPWLDSQDYPYLLASADLGVSLHTSSSGLDLPMKVIDMFGCGLPVCAFNFNCLNELVIHEKNSYVFSNSEELSKQILNWFENFPHNEKQKEIESNFKTELATFQTLRWRENWSLVAAPIFK